MENFIYNKRIYYSPIEFAMAHIGGTWKILILLNLRNGPLRYADLKKSIPNISDKMLYTQLRDLEEKGMVTRQAFIEKPPRVEYQMTIVAEKVVPILDQLTEYGKFLMKGTISTYR
nr:helix-turn-helix domain-containing protein [Pedobacter sp. ASV2]